MRKMVQRVEGLVELGHPAQTSVPLTPPRKTPSPPVGISGHFIPSSKTNSLIGKLRVIDVHISM